MTDPIQPAAAIIGEAETLWELDLKPAGCPQCGKAFLVEVSRIGQVCPGCATGRLESQPVRLRPEPPELLIPFQKRPDDLLPILDQFVKPVWLRPAELNTRLLLERLTPLYWPMWLVDSDLTGDWQAEMGYDYQVKSSQESYTKAGWKTQEQIETRIRWEPRLGELNRHYDNISATALNDTDFLLTQIGATDRKYAQPYHPTAVGQSVIRIPDLNPENAWPLAQSALNQSAAEECRQAAQAQHLRNYTIHTAYTNLHWTQLLQPMYTSYYLDDQGKPQVIFINGQNGVTGGIRRASQRKGCLWSGFGCGVSAFLVFIYILLVLVGQSIEGLSTLAMMSICAAVATAGMAIAPAFWAWRWNRKLHSQQVIRK